MKIVETKVLLQYGREGEPTSGFSKVHSTEADQFVDLDSASGGYPYPTNIDRAHNFGTIEKALEYSRHVKGFYPRRVTITYSFEQTERLVTCPGCKGSGSISDIVDHDHDYEPVWQDRTCPVCSGTGKTEA